MGVRSWAARVSRPRRWGLAAAGLLAIAQFTGCSHHKQTTYRPIFARPTTVATPCTNCGSSSAITTEGATSVPSTTVPSLSAPSVDSSVAPSTSIRRGSGAVRNSTVEPAPRAHIGPEPEYYEEMSPTTGNNRAKPPSSPPAPASPGAGPALLAPKTGEAGTPTTWNANGPDARLAGRAGARTESTSLSGLESKLEPFIAGSSTNELFYPNKADRPWRYIVLHHSASAAGNYDEIDREHRKLLGYDGCGYHFVIGNGNGSGDGQIEVAQRWNRQKQGVHCRNARSHDVDEYGIGICLVGDLDQQPPTPRQVAATRALVAYLGQRYRIEPARVTTHAHLAATPTVCPGKFFPSTILASDAAQERPAS
jgi:hypothetical protein